MSLTLTLPTADEALLGFIVVGATIQIVRALTGHLDQDIQGAPEVKGLSALARGVLSRLLNASHHWYIGGLLYYYAATRGLTLTLPLVGWVLDSYVLQCIGVGLLLDDYEDIPGRLKDVVASVRNSFYGGNPAGTERLILPGPGLYQVVIPPPPDTDPAPAPQVEAPKAGDLKAADGGRVA